MVRCVVNRQISISHCSGKYEIKNQPHLRAACTVLPVRLVLFDQRLMDEAIRW